MNLAKFITYTLWFAGTAFAISYIATHKGVVGAGVGVPVCMVTMVGSASWIVMFIALLIHEFED